MLGLKGSRYARANSCPHEKINRCLTDINRCLTNTENQFYKVSAILVKYWLSIGLYRLYPLNVSLLIFLP